MYLFSLSSPRFQVSAHGLIAFIFVFVVEHKIVFEKVYDLVMCIDYHSFAYITKLLLRLGINAEPSIFPPKNFRNQLSFFTKNVLLQLTSWRGGFNSALDLNVSGLNPCSHWPMMKMG